jgi:hypothetical protein
MLALALTALAVTRLLVERVPGDPLYALFGALAGPIGESLLAETGAFSYANPDIWQVPIWLAPLWANAALMIRRVLAPIALPVTGPDRRGIPPQ